MNTPNNQNPGLLVSFLRYCNRQITHPISAWFLFLMLVFSNLVHGWALERLFHYKAESLVQRALLDRQIIGNQDLILKELRK